MLIQRNGRILSGTAERVADLSCDATKAASHLMKRQTKGPRFFAALIPFSG
jgi:hypothetical protein